MPATPALTPRDLGFDPWDPAFIADPFPVLARLRASHPLDLRRQPNPHVSFGAGIHYCLGAPLARMELQIAFTTVLRRAPSIELVATPTWKPTSVLRGLQALQVRL